MAAGSLGGLPFLSDEGSPPTIPQPGSLGGLPWLGDEGSPLDTIQTPTFSHTHTGTVSLQRRVILTKAITHTGTVTTTAGIVTPTAPSFTHTGTVSLQRKIFLNSRAITHTGTVSRQRLIIPLPKNFTHTGTVLLDRSSLADFGEFGGLPWLADEGATASVAKMGHYGVGNFLTRPPGMVGETFNAAYVVNTNVTIGTGSR